ncbi:MAG: F0F1 ATP synthase subunit epsilon [Acidobacteria bacterium]|nr:F0F1 ATP synthase subunit epsilon [Acidobacteriota bacterium]
MLKLEIVTPERRVVDETVDSVTVPTLSGEAGILPNHAPLISALKPGILSFTNKGTTERLAVAGGFVEVSSDMVSVLTDVAETTADINIEAAKAEREAAEKALAANSTKAVEETEAFRDELDLANARLQLAGR